MKILIVDDSKQIRFILQRLLERWGYEVIAACNGMEAWQYIQCESINLIISDWVMPQMDGLELYRRLRTNDFVHYVYIILLMSRDNKADLIEGMEAGADDFLIKETTQVVVDPDSLFDIQVKRIHEYKRQLLNVFHIIHDYLCLIEDGIEPVVLRTYVFAGKAAPSYWSAKQIIKLINNIGQVINNDPRVHTQIKVVFIPDYRVSLAEKIIPAADVSEQISTAGTEASGISNMKFALNGALTIGTLDGANVEIGQEVGEANIFIFGLTAEEIAAHHRDGTYHPQALYRCRSEIRRIMDTFTSDRFCRHKSGLFHWIYQAILHGGDPYFLLADFESYVAAHGRLAQEYTDAPIWLRKSILNVVRAGKFSSDRTITEYARDIWGVSPVV